MASDISKLKKDLIFKIEELSSTVHTHTALDTVKKCNYKKGIVRKQVNQFKNTINSINKIILQCATTTCYLYYMQ